MLLPSPSEYLSTNLAVYGLLVVGIVLVLSWQSGHFRKKLDIPRLGPEPSIFGNTSKGEFYNNSVALIEEGYAKVYQNTYDSLINSEIVIVQGLALLTMDDQYGSRDDPSQIHG